MPLYSSKADLIRNSLQLWFIWCLRLSYKSWYSSAQYDDWIPFIKRSHPRMFWWRMALISFVFFRVSRLEELEYSWEYEISSTMLILNSKVARIQSGVPLDCRFFKNVWRRLVLAKWAWMSRHCQTWVMVSTLDWHRGHRAECVRPCWHNVPYMRIQS
jgi:hypothetical protein